MNREGFLVFAIGATALSIFFAVHAALIYAVVRLVKWAWTG